MTNPRILCCMLLVVAMAVASAQTSGTASGTLTFNGKATKLSYSQAVKAQDWIFGADHKPVLATVIRVFLSDMPVDDQEDNFELSVRAKEGKLHGLQITFSKDGKLLNGSLYHEAIQSGVESIFLSTVLFERKVFDDKTVAGKVGTKTPIDLSGKTLDISITFSSPFQQEPKPTVEGAAAAETAPGKAVQEFIRAAEAKDVAALKRIVRKEVAEMLEKPEGQEAIMAMLGGWYPAGKKIKLVRVFDFGDRAWVEGESQRPGDDGKPINETYKIRAIRVNGEWKVSPL